MKKLFETTKRAVISTICIIAVIAIAAAVTGMIVLKSTLINKEEAKEAALRDAGLSASEISGCRTELDYDDGRFQYEVEFYSNGTEYEYVIQAKDGGIISRDIDTDGVKNASSQNNPQKSENQSAQNNSQQSGNQPSQGTSAENEKPSVSPAADNGSTDSGQSAVISVEEAKGAALADAGLTEAEVTFTKTRLDKDGSVQVYDIEFYTAEAEYDYEIIASDGSIKERDMEIFRTQTGSGSGGSSDEYIGVDKAKEIAVNDAGLTEAEVQFSKAKLENDDGRVEYEVEFYAGNTEYEYKIDAVTGRITEFSSELLH